MAKVLNINADQFEGEVLKSSVPTLVDFWAPWCAPCRMMGPTLDEIAKDLAPKVRVIKIDIDQAENAGLARQFHIMSIPNMKLFQDGNVVQEFVGTRSKSDLVSGIKKFL